MINKYNYYFATENKKQLKKILSLCIDIFGGYTLINTFGGWKDANNIKHIEKAYKLTIFTDKEKEIKPLAKYINFNCNQQTTIIETENKIKFIN